MNYTFNLTYEDLFISLNDKYYFLVIFHKKFYGDWVLGEPFLKKYNIIFDQKSETISFYTQSNIKKKKDTPRKDNKFLIILVIIFFVSTIILSFLLYLCIKKIPRKKRANELEENFDYVSKEFPQKTDYQKLLN
jgi:preprotein translocase subunit SecG